MQKEDADSLWVVFRVAGNQYAINSDDINGISKEPDKVTLVPDAKPYVKGIIKIRGNIITLLDMRTIFGFISLDRDYEEFCTWLDGLKQKHMEWMEELTHCVHSKKVFAAWKDAYSQIPGIAYQSGRLNMDAVRVLFDKANETSKKLKEEAACLENLAKRDNPLQDETEGCLKKAEQYLLQILSYIDKAKEAYQESCHRMMVVIKSKTEQREIGLIVDEIVGVDKIGITFFDSTLDKMEHSSLIRAAASSREGEDLILLLDEKELFNLGISAKEQKEKSMA